MKRAFAAGALVVLSACGGGKVAPRTAEVTVSFAQTGNTCQGHIEPKTVRVAEGGEVTWKEGTNGCGGTIHWEPTDFKKKFLFCFLGSQSDQLPPVQGDPKHRQAKSKGGYCYTIKATLGERPIEVDPEVDIIRNK